MKITREEKRKYVLEHGWVELWSEDNFVRKDKQYIDIDRSGVSLETAFTRAVEEEESKELMKEYKEKRKV